MDSTDSTKISGRFGKGNPGKPKGATNHLTRELKDMILGALDKAGGIDYLQRQANENPTAFLSLVGKVLPMTVKHQGDAQSPIVLVTGIAREPADG